MTEVLTMEMEQMNNFNNQCKLGQGKRGRGKRGRGKRGQGAPPWNDDSQAGYLPNSSTTVLKSIADLFQVLDLLQHVIP